MWNGKAFENPHTQSGGTGVRTPVMASDTSNFDISTSWIRICGLKNYFSNICSLYFIILEIFNQVYYIKNIKLTYNYYIMSIQNINCIWKYEINIWKAI
jgi:hypothetical protein